MRVIAVTLLSKLVFLQFRYCCSNSVQC